MFTTADRTRRTETPNAVMTTLASPSLGATDSLSMWLVEMEAGRRGPVHVVDSEQVWTVLAGEAAFALAGDTEVLAAGDTAVLPAGAERQITAVSGVRLLVAGHGDATVSVPGEPAPRGTPPWIA